MRPSRHRMLRRKKSPSIPPWERRVRPRPTSRRGLDRAARVGRRSDPRFRGWPGTRAAEVRRATPPSRREGVPGAGRWPGPDLGLRGPASLRAWRGTPPSDEGARARILGVESVPASRPSRFDEPRPCRGQVVERFGLFPARVGPTMASRDWRTLVSAKPNLGTLRGSSTAGAFAKGKGIRNEVQVASSADCRVWERCRCRRCGSCSSAGAGLSRRRSAARCGWPDLACHVG